jgi:hypothetical protein
VSFDFLLDASCLLLPLMLTALQSSSPAGPQADAPQPPEGETETATPQLPPPVTDPFLDSLTGRWECTTHFMGMVLESWSEVRWVCNHQFVQGITHSRGAIGEMESQEIWQPSPVEGVYRFWWFDPFGSAGCAEARTTATGFVITGNDAASGAFRNVTTQLNADEMRFALEEGPDEAGAYKPIAEGHFRRTDR